MKCAITSPTHTMSYSHACCNFCCSSFISSFCRLSHYKFFFCYLCVYCDHSTDYTESESECTARSLTKHTNTHEAQFFGLQNHVMPTKYDNVLHTVSINVHAANSLSLLLSLLTFWYFVIFALCFHWSFPLIHVFIYTSYFLYRYCSCFFFSCVQFLAILSWHSQHINRRWI